MAASRSPDCATTSSKRQSRLPLPSCFAHVFDDSPRQSTPPDSLTVSEPTTQRMHIKTTAVTTPKVVRPGSRSSTTVCRKSVIEVKKDSTLTTSPTTVVKLEPQDHNTLKAEFLELRHCFAELAVTVAKQHAQIKALSQEVADLKGKVEQNPQSETMPTKSPPTVKLNIKARRQSVRQEPASETSA